MSTVAATIGEETEALFQSLESLAIEIKGHLQAEPFFRKTPSRVSSLPGTTEQHQAPRWVPRTRERHEAPRGTPGK